MKKTGNKNLSSAATSGNSLDRLQMISLATREGIWEYDIISKKAYYNDGMFKLFGYSPEEMKDNHTWWRNNVHPSDISEVIGQMDILLGGTESIWWGQYKFLCKNGEYKKILDRLFVVRDSNNKPLKIIGAMQDIEVLDIFERQVENINNEHRKNMIQAIINSEENERKKISEELHENINQVLAAVGIKISTLRKMNPGEQSGLNEVQEMLTYSIKEIRSIAQRLSPLTLEPLGLKTALIDLLNTLKIQKNIQYSIVIDDKVIQKLDANIKTLLYRIAQLQIVNIRKHSDANNVYIKINSLNEKLSMTIYDDGKGINLKNFKFGQGFLNIQERVEAFDGTFNLKSVEDEKGCILTVII